MSQEQTMVADLRLERNAALALPRLVQGNGPAPAGSVLVRRASTPMTLEAWFQVTNPLQSGELYACCYLYNWAEDRWSLQDERFQCTGNIHAAFVPEEVRAACQSSASSEPLREPHVLAVPPVSAVAPVSSPLSAKVEEEVQRFEGHRYWIESVAFSPDGRRVLSGSGQPIGVGQSDFDFTVRVWDLDSGRELRGLQGHTNWVTSVHFSPDGQRVLSGSYDHSVRLWEVETGKELRRFLGHTDRIRSVALSPNGRRALSGGYDKMVRLWHVETGEEMLRFRNHQHWVISVAFSPDGRQAASGSYDKTVRLWSCERGSWFGAVTRLAQPAGGRELHCFQGHEHSVTGVAFLPDSRHLLSGSMDKTLRLWDIRTVREVRRLQGHTMGITSLAVSPDGRRVLSTSLDETIRLWDIETGKEIHCFKGHQDVVTSVAFSPDGRQAVSGSADRTVRVWRLPG